MLVVADSSPLHYLVLIQHEAILPALYERAAIPPAALVDLQHSRTPDLVRVWTANRPAWLEVHRPRQVLDARQFPRLGAGEREAIALARELEASLLLIDDADGRSEAERHALTVTGTLGILETAAIHGLVDLPSALTRLQATTFRAKPELFQDLLERDAARKRPMERLRKHPALGTVSEEGMRKNILPGPTGVVYWRLP